MENDLEINDKQIPLISEDDRVRESRFLSTYLPNRDDDRELIEGKGWSGYKDVFFLFLFIINLVILGAIAVSYGGVSLLNSHAEYWIVKTNGTEYIDHSYDNIPLKFMTGLTIILIASTVLSVGWIYLLSQVASLFMNFVILSMTSGSALLGFIVLFLGYPYFAFTLMVLALVILGISYLYQHRLEFASMNLQVACKAILAVPSILHYSVYLTFIQAMFLILWAVAAVGFATNSYHITKTYQGKTYTLDQCSTYRYSNDFEVNGISLTCSSGSNCYSCICDGTVVSSTNSCFTPKLYYSTFIFLLLSLFWVSAVISNIVHCTTSAAVYSWWKTGQCSDESLKNSFDKITTKSLGSICFGSLLTAFVRTIRSILHFIATRMNKQQTNGPESRTFLGYLNYLSRNLLFAFTEMLDRMILYFNRYAFCFVALYGVSYLDAAKAAVQLFKSRGLTTLFNDDIIDLIVLVSEVIISLVCLVTAYVYARFSGITGAYLYLFEICAVITGYVMSLVILSTIQSAVTTVYVSFARNSRDFEVVHPTLYVSLANSWEKIFPGFLNLSETKTLNGNQLQQRSLVTDLSVSESSPPVDSGPKTVRGTYHPPQFVSPNPSGPSSLYSSVMNMVLPVRGGYQKLDTDDMDGSSHSYGQHGARLFGNLNSTTTSAVTSLGLAMKDLAKDPFGMKAPPSSLTNQKKVMMTMEDSFSI